MSHARVIAAAALLAAAGAARAQEPHAHEGFFLQLDLGLGYLRSEIDEGGLDAQLDGGAGELSVAVGYNVGAGFVVGGQIWGVSAVEPDLEIDGRRVSTDDSTLSLSGVGVNLTYYFSPQNVYVQATPSITTLSLERDDVELDTDPGFGLRLAVGKEWWVSDSWAIGLNVQAAVSSNDADAGGGSFGSQWYGVAFSATYD